MMADMMIYVMWFDPKKGSTSHGRIVKTKMTAAMAQRMVIRLFISICANSGFTLNASLKIRATLR